MEQGDAGGSGILRGESRYLSRDQASSSGEQGFLSGLYDAEVELIRKSQPSERDVFREDMVSSAMENMGSMILDPSGERFKLEFLAEWAMKEGGVTSPVDFLNLVMQASKSGSSRWPNMAPIDAAYKLARESRAYKDLEEARRVT